MCSNIRGPCWMIFEKKSSLGDRTKVQSTPSAVARGDGALEGVEKPKKWPKKSANALSDALLMSRFQNFAADAAKKKPRFVRFFETALRAALINPLIRGQTFSVVVFFTGVQPSSLVDIPSKIRPCKLWRGQKPIRDSFVDTCSAIPRVISLNAFCLRVSTPLLLHTLPCVL